MTLSSRMGYLCNLCFMLKILHTETTPYFLSSALRQKKKFTFDPKHDLWTCSHFEESTKLRDHNNL